MGVACANSPSAPAASPQIEASPGHAAPAGSPSPSNGPLRVTASVERWGLAAPLSREVVFPAGHALIVAGGLEDADVSTSRVTRLNVSTGRRTGHWSLPAGVHDAAGIVAGGADLVVGGGAGAATGAVQGFPVTGGTPHQVGSLPQPRSDLSATTARGKSYIVGGFSGSNMASAVLVTRDGKTFRTLAQLPIPVRYAAVAVAGGALWVVGGRTDPGGVSTTAAVQRVDLRTGRAVVASHLAAPLSDASAVTINGTVLVCGGDRNGASATDRVLRLDTVTGRLTPAGRLAYPVADFGAAVLGSGTSAVAYLVGGENATREVRVQTIRLD